jgi:hypothetical protein
MGIGWEWTWEFPGKMGIGLGFPPPALSRARAGDRMTLDKVRLLGLIATRGQSEEMPMPARTVSPAKSAVQVEIDKIRADKNYISSDSKVRAPLVKRMGELMAQLHGSA